MTELTLPNEDWPLKRRVTRRSVTPYGYIISPDDEYLYVPDPVMVQNITRALDHIDAGNSLRSVAEWLSEKNGKPVSHMGLSNIWKRIRGDARSNARAKKLLKIKKAGAPKTPEERVIKAAKVKAASAKRTIIAARKRIEKAADIIDTPVVDNGNIDPERYAAAQELKDYAARTEEVIFKPNDGPQTEFLASSEQEVLYGGPLALDTKVMTDKGYVRIGDIKVGDNVFTPTGNTATVIDIPFVGDEDSYKLTFNDGTTVVASAGHEWRVSTSDWKKTNAPWRTKRTNELLDFKLSRGRNKYMLPKVEPLVWPAAMHVISPYILGVLLGDGTFVSHKTPSFVSVDMDIVNRVAEEAPEGLEVRSSGSPINWSIARAHGTRESNPITLDLARLGLTGKTSFTKFIPDEYKYDSVENRLALLRGLMDTDGTTRNGNRRSSEAKYTTVSVSLKDDFVFLAQSLGFRVTWYSEVLTNGTTAFRVLISGELNPFHLERKNIAYGLYNQKVIHKYITSIEPVGVNKVMCITIDAPEHLFLIDNLTVTHNSAGGGKSFALLADPMRYFNNPNFNGILFRKTNDELRELIMKSQQLYPRAYPGAKWAEKKSEWTFPSGAHMWFTYLDRDEDVERYQGQAFTWVGFDELGHWATPYAWDYMRSRLRSTDPTIDLAQRCTANPGGVGMWWIKRLFVDPAPTDTSFNATDVEGRIMVYPEYNSQGQPHPKAGQPLFQRKFIPARLHNNPYLYNDGRYEASLLSLPENKRRQLLDGDWTISDGAAFPEFRLRDHVIEPFDIPSDWRRFRSCDYGYSSFSCVHWFAIDPMDETLILYRELYVSKHTGRDLAAKIIPLEQQEKILYGVLDSSVWHQRGQTGPSIAEEMIMAGCRWRPADRSSGSRSNGKNRLHELLKLGEVGFDYANGKPIMRPGIQIFNNCRQIIADLPIIPADPNGKDDIDDRYASDHSYDALRYGIMSRPRSSSPFDFDDATTRASNGPSDKVFGY